MSEPSTLGPRWRVMRQDDNGNQFEVTRYADESEAAAHVARFESGEYPHHHLYWFEPCPDRGV